MFSSWIYDPFEENRLYEAVNNVKAMIEKQSRYYPCNNRFRTSTVGESDKQGMYSSTTVVSFDSQKKQIDSLSPKTVAMEDKDSISPLSSLSLIQTNKKTLTSLIHMEVCQWMYNVSWILIATLSIYWFQTHQLSMSLITTLNLYFTGYWSLFFW